jgi:hypothetical protein
VADKDDEKSEIALALEERSKNRPTILIDGLAFTGPGSKIVGAIAMRVATKQEENAAIAQAEVYVRDLGKSGSVDLKDPELVRDARTVYILHAVCRDPKRPNSAAAFTSPREMMALMTRDEIAKLLNHYNRFAESVSPFDFDLSPEKVDEVSAQLAQLSGTDLADALVQSKDRVWLEQYAIRVSMQLADARQEVAMTRAMSELNDAT